MSIDAGLELTPGLYPHSQVKDRDEATMVTRGSTLQLLMAGRITWLLREACDPQFPRFRNSMSVEVVGVLTVERELLSNIWRPSVLVNIMTLDHTAVLVSHCCLESHWVWQ